MPLYEFHCRDCEKDSELLIRSGKWKGAKCPACGSERLVKKLSVFSAAHSQSSGAADFSCTGNPESCACSGGDAE